MLTVIYMLVTTLHICAGARILAIAPMPSYSHQIFFRPIWKVLADRGHQLLLLTTDPMEHHANIEQIDLHFTYNVRNSVYNITKIVQENEYNIPKIIDTYAAMTDDIVDAEMRHPEVQELLKSRSEHFDLMIVEYIHPLFFAFAHKFNCPYITVASTDIANFYHKTMGNPIHPVLYPEIFMPFQTDLNLKQRVLSTLYVVYGIYKKHFFGDHQGQMARKYFGEKVPSLKSIARNVSLVFINVNPVFNVRPLGPGFVRIGGGFHIGEEKPLPQELKEYLDNATEGVVYFSLGTNVKSNHVKGAFINAMIGAFRELPYKILWKFESDLPTKSSNVKIVKWVPQQDVLRHKNIKVFITQCGMQSLEEAIFSRVPMIAIPFAAEQKMNAQKVANRKIGIMLDKNVITKTIVIRSIKEIIHDTSYVENIDAVATMMTDEPMTNLEKVVWWTEYVIRHKGVRHFWHPNLDLPTYQYLLLDVLGITVIVILILLYFIYKSVRIFSRMIESRVKEKIN